MAKQQRGAEIVAVIANDVGQRLDNFLIRTLKGIPRGRVYRLLRTGQVRVNGGRRKPAYRLAEGDQVRLPPRHAVTGAPPLEADDERVTAVHRRVLLERDGLLVLDKPAGEAVHAGTGVRYGLIDRVRATPRWSQAQLAHRLDRGTSGCLVFGLTRAALNHFQRRLEAHEVAKRYLLLVEGAPAEEKVTVTAPLTVGSGRGQKVRVDEQGQTATTVFHLLERFAGAALLEAEPITGRTHQIRIHAAHAGWPLAGDERYGSADANRRFARAGLTRLFLHCHRLDFAAPDGEAIMVHAELPEELRAVLDRVGLRGGPASRRR